MCPNFSNPEVKKEFDELTSMFGENMAYLLWDRNNGHNLDKAPNGQSSKLYKSLLDLADRRTAFTIKAKTLTSNFKEWFGNSQVVDENGEPLIQDNTFISESKQLKSIFNSGEYNRNSDNIYDSKTLNTIENRRQTQINGSISNEIKSNFENFFPDLAFYNDEQREAVASLVENGNVQITCKF